MLLVIQKCVPRARIRWKIRVSIIGGRLAHYTTIIISSYSCHGHFILVDTLASFGNHYFYKLFHVSSSMLHRNFKSVMHFYYCLLVPPCVSFWKTSKNIIFYSSRGTRLSNMFAIIYASVFYISFLPFWKRFFEGLCAISHKNVYWIN